MGIQVEHELHRRRAGRNLGVGLVLGAFIVIIFGLTFVKVSNESFALPKTATQTAVPGQGQD